MKTTKEKLFFQFFKDDIRRIYSPFLELTLNAIFGNLPTEFEL